MQIAICDDDLNIHTTLTDFILSLKSDDVSDDISDDISKEDIDYYTSAEDLLSSNKNYDIVFMDIYMPTSNGIEAISRLSSNQGKCVVFMTSIKDHAFEAFHLGAVHYLLKPLRESDVHESLKRCKDRLTLVCEPFLTIEMSNKIINIPYRQIHYIEAINKQTLIHTDKRVYTLYLSLNTLETKLDKQQFMRAQRSYIVNMAFIATFNKSHILLENDQEIILSRIHQNELKAQYEKYLFALNRRTP